MGFRMCVVMNDLFYVYLNGAEQVFARGQEASATANIILNYESLFPGMRRQYQYRAFGEGKGLLF